VTVVHGAIKMSNGAPDCGTCDYNLATRELGIPEYAHSAICDFLSEQNALPYLIAWRAAYDKEWHSRYYCLLRKLQIRNDPKMVDTYCNNRLPSKGIGHHVDVGGEDVLLQGPMICEGLYESIYHTPIPWHNEIEPIIVWPEIGVDKRKSQPVDINDFYECDICGKKTEKFILIEDKQTFAFCCNKHYLIWWNERHPDQKWELDKL